MNPSEKQLVQDIEKAGGLYKVNFAEICESDIRFYGKKGSKIRRESQIKVANLKRRTINSYISYLTKAEVEPSPHTKFCSQSQSRPVESGSFEMNSSTGSPASSSDSEGESAQRKNFASNFEERLSLTKMEREPKSPLITPSRGPYVTSGQPRSAKRSVKPSPKRVPSYTRSSSTVEEPPLQIMVSKMGTQDNPFPIYVDLEETHLNLGFDIARVVGTKHEHHKYAAFHIRRSVDVPDFMHWSAYVPHSNSLPMNEVSRVIIIKGPSKSYWFRDQDELYHDNLEEKDACPVLKDTLVARSLTFNTDPNKFFFYWKLIFPEGTDLDNAVYSNDLPLLKRDFVSMGLRKEESDFTVDIPGVILVFKIAERGGVRVSKEKDEVPELDFYGTKKKNKKK